MEIKTQQTHILSIVLKYDCQSKFYAQMQLKLLKIKWNRNNNCLHTIIYVLAIFPSNFLIYIRTQTHYFFLLFNFSYLKSKVKRLQLHSYNIFISSSSAIYTLIYRKKKNQVTCLLTHLLPTLVPTCTYGQHFNVSYVIPAERTLCNKMLKMCNDITRQKRTSKCSISRLFTLTIKFLM